MSRLFGGRRASDGEVKTASEIIRDLEIRVARLEKQSVITLTIPFFFSSKLVVIIK